MKPARRIQNRQRTRAWNILTREEQTRAGIKRSLMELGLGPRGAENMATLFSTGNKQSVRRLELVGNSRGGKKMRKEIRKQVRRGMGPSPARIRRRKKRK